MKKQTLKFKLVWGGVITVLIPLLVVGLFAIVKSSESLEAAARERAMSGAVQLADLVQEVIRVELKVAGAMATSSDALHAVAGTDLEGIGKRMADAMKHIGEDYASMLITDAKGIVIVDGSNGANRGATLADRDYFLKAKEGKANVGSVVKSRKTGNPVATICVPIMQDKTFLGAVVVALKIDYLADKVTTKMGKTGYGFMVDKAGVVIAHHDKDRILTSKLAAVKGMESIVQKITERQTGVLDYTAGGTKKIAGFAPVAITGWSVVMTQNTDEFLAASRSIRNFIAVVGILFLGITIIAVVFFAGRLALPIKKAAEEMSKGAGQVAVASHQVAAASQSLAEGASEQAAALEETSSSLEQMASMTKQNADNAAQTDGLMKQVNLVIRQTKETMDALTRSMKEISEASDETTKIIKTIDEIAFQTNLLALNAAVEAARAGEAGAGFAVVADEVRNLAIRAAEAARNTSGLIEDITQEIREGSDLVTRTNATFAEVSANTLTAGGLVGEIAAASREQSHGIDQINKAVSEMDRVVQTTAANAEESASASEEMNEQAEQMKRVASVLVGIIGGNAFEDRGGHLPAVRR